MKICLVFCLILILCSPSSRAEGPITPASARTSVERGIGWMLKHQAEAGFFDARLGAPLPKEAKPNYFPNSAGALSALAVMAFHKSGHRANESTPEGRAMAKAVAFVCREMPMAQSSAETVGYLGKKDHSHMYGHGIMAWMLATVAHELPDKALERTALELTSKAVELIVSSQRVHKDESATGGWRYEPQSSDSDLMITAWQLMALRAAAQVGIKVPEETVKAASEYVKRCCKNGSSADERIFLYELPKSRETTGTTAAGVVALQCCGLPDALEAKGGLERTKQHEFTKTELWLYNGLYFASHALKGAGSDASGAFAAKVSGLLVPLQSGDGSWSPASGNEKAAGAIFTTALAVMALAPWTEKVAQK